MELEEYEDETMDSGDVVEVLTPQGQAPHSQHEHLDIPQTPMYIDEPCGKGNEEQAPAIVMNNRQAISSVSRNQQVIETGAGNHQHMLQHSPVSGKNNQQSLTSRMRNQHVCNSGLSKQQAMSVGVANQQGNLFNHGNQAEFVQLLLILTPLLDRDKRMQLQTVYHKHKRNEITKAAFFRHMRTIVGDQMLKIVVYTLQLQYGRMTQEAFNQSMANLVGVSLLQMVMELNSRIPLAPSPTIAKTTKIRPISG